MSLLKNFATVGGATASSRILGFIRDTFIASALGTGAVADAYVVAFRLPNLFRRLFAEGAFSSAFVPMFARQLEGEGPEVARQFAAEAQAALGGFLFLLTIVALVFMPEVVAVLAPGFLEEPAKFELTVQLARIAFPYLWLISLQSLYAGVLNGLGRFAAAAFSPTLLNVALISALVAVFWLHWDGSATAGFALSWAITIGGVLQLAMLVGVAIYRGMALPLLWPRLTVGVKRLCLLAGPSVVAGGVIQINIIVGTMIASAQPGAVAWLYFADRVYQLPLGIVGIAIGTVLLPDIARRVRAGDMGAVLHNQNRSVEFALALTLPAAVALVVTALPVTVGLFQRGAFSHADAIETASALAAYGLGLPAFVLLKVFQPAFFARENTKTPMWYSAINVGVNVALSFALFPIYGHVGVALATTIASWLNVVMLFVALKRAGIFQGDARLRSVLVRIVLASAIFGGVLYGIGQWLAAWFIEGDPTAPLGLAILVGVGLVVYAVLVVALGIIRPADLKRLVRRRR
ncbi:murein biosynthesis integral membrane protein MurJ [Segnochrobactraceae bacterium EtOH-i3]